MYKPAVKSIIMNALKESNQINASSESLIFAICFTSVSTMSLEDCRSLLQGERGLLLVRYRYGLEKALAQVGWMTTQDICVLQALTLYIVRLACL